MKTMRFTLMLAAIAAALVLPAAAQDAEHFTVIHTFSGGGGAGDPGTQLVEDSAGNFYGSTLWDGNYQGCSKAGCSVVYRLSPQGTGWTSTVLYELSRNSGGGYAFNLLYTFAGGNGGGNSFNPLTLDSSGNLFGSALGGAHNWGVVFELSPSSSGWTYGLVHTFTGGADGGQPGGLIFDAAGNLYGTAVYGAKPGCLNNGGCGTIFKLSSTAPVGHE